MANLNQATAALKDGTGQRLYERARTLIPGGTQLFSKRPEMFAPKQWPTYFAEATGCEVVDMDGKRFVDMCTCGIGATVLGYADPDVTAAVQDRVAKGVMCMLNPPDEVELAELMLQIHPWAQMVRFGRMGGESMTMAVRIARASTRRDRVAFCGYHGWHDWYLSANLPEDPKVAMDDRLGDYHLMPGLEPAGVPRGLTGTALPFHYNKIDQLKAIVDKHGSELAAIVMEPIRHFDPEPGFLEGVRDLADRSGARLIFDEITIGWKLCLGGAHLKLGIEPDVAVFAKTTGNGHPISAVIGKAETMQAAQDTFISSALWTEAVGPAAGVATVKKLMRIDVPAHIARVGQQARDGLATLAKEHRVPLQQSGRPGMTFYNFEHPKAPALQTLWTVRMLERGYLVCGGFYPMYAHTPEHVGPYLEATAPVFAEIGEAIEKDDIEVRIGGPVQHTGFQRLA